MISKGQKINDRYQIIRTIGEGGMANVYLAYDTILDRNVAVKILRGDLADDEKFVRRFQREAIAASSLSHQNVVEMYDVGEDDGKYFIVMEYIEGRTLKSLIKRRGALSLPEVVDIMLQLTSGISCAHNSYIIHRDIKPQNVLILDDGRVKITDFGIAMALNNELTQTNSVMGSVHYLPPEQANGNGSTNKSDIYSLGILMFELITGKLPFKGDNAVEIAIKQMKEQIPSITRLNPSIPQSVENVILKACAKNPKNRYDSAAAMHEDIKTVLDENREDEHRVIYMYPEEDLDSTKTIPNLESVGSKRRETSYDKQEKNKNSKKNKPLIILASIFVALIAVLLTIFFIIPTIIDSKEIVVPSVANM
ncbi:MAG: Stk1 family PASTA domain-containing Ser/Thr kinase, partial [Bacilli bacterium]